MKTIKLVVSAFGKVLDKYFASDNDVMSEEGKMIFENETDRKLFLEGFEKMKQENQHESTIMLSNDKTIKVTY